MPTSTAEKIIDMTESQRDNVVKLFNDKNGTPKTKSNKANVPHRAECIKSLDDINKINNFFISHKRYRDSMMLIVGICTGLRISDLCALNIGDVINKDGTFKEYIDIIEKKTGKHSANLDDRCLITEAMQDVISKYLRRKRTWSLKEPLLYSRKLNSDGEHRLSEESGWRIMKQAQRDIGIDYNLGSHSLRKTFANIAACCGSESNIDMNKLIQIQHMLKHGDYKTTMRYLNLNSVFTSRARQDVSDFILGKTNYNDLSEALFSQESESHKLSVILDQLDTVINRLE